MLVSDDNNDDDDDDNDNLIIKMINNNDVSNDKVFVMFTIKSDKLQLQTQTHTQKEW